MVIENMNHSEIELRLLLCTSKKSWKTSEKLASLIINKHGGLIISLAEYFESSWTKKYLPKHGTSLHLWADKQWNHPADLPAWPWEHMAPSTHRRTSCWWTDGWEYTAHKEIQCMTCSTNSGERSQHKIIGNKKDKKDFTIIIFKRLKKVKINSVR